MKRRIVTFIFLFTLLVPVTASPVLAQTSSEGVSQIQTFIQSVIDVFVTLSALVAAGFFIYGGFGYITSSGNPDALEKSKKTLMYSGIGLTIVLAAFVLSNIVSDLATGAFGSGQ